MNTEEKIREAYERITTNSGFKQTVGGFICFKAGYLAAQKEAFEQAAKVCGERADIFNKLYSREAAGAICCRHEIRQLIKE